MRHPCVCRRRGRVGRGRCFRGIVRRVVVGHRATPAEWPECTRLTPGTVVVSTDIDRAIAGTQSPARAGAVMVRSGDAGRVRPFSRPHTWSGWSCPVWYWCGLGGTGLRPVRTGSTGRRPVPPRPDTTNRNVNKGPDSGVWRPWRSWRPWPRRVTRRHIPFPHPGSRRRVFRWPPTVAVGLIGLPERANTQLPKHHAPSRSQLPHAGRRPRLQSAGRIHPGEDTDAVAGRHRPGRGAWAKSRRRSR